MFCRFREVGRAALNRQQLHPPGGGTQSIKRTHENEGYAESPAIPGKEGRVAKPRRGEPISCGDSRRPTASVVFMNRVLALPRWGGRSVQRPPDRADPNP